MYTLPPKARFSSSVGNGLFNSASLDLHFAKTKSLVDATTGTNLIDFTRASSGTYVGSDGLIKTATTNLLLRSEEFDNASWQKGGSSVTPNTTTSPDGLLSADKIIESATLDLHYVFQVITVTAGLTYTVSVYMKAAERTEGILQLSTFNSAFLANSTAYFNLSTGTIRAAGAGLIASSIVPLPNGWHRCSITATAQTTANAIINTGGISNGTVNYYTGDGASGLYIWGAQLEQSSTVGEYVKTTSTINSAPRFDHDPTTGESLGLLVEESRTNLLLRSEEFQTTWSTGGLLAFGGGSIADAIQAPNGAQTADFIVEDTTLATHGVFQTVSTSSGATIAFSVYVKAGGKNFCRLVIRNNASAGDSVFCFYDLVNGTAGSPSAVGTGIQNGTSIQAMGNGWYRCSLVGSVPTATTYRLDINTATSISNAFYTGDGTSGIYIWGAQLEDGSFPTSYIPTEGSAVTRAADVASISGSNFSSWYNATQGTVFTSQKTPVTNGQQGAYWFSTPPTVGRGIAGIIDTRDVAQRLTVYNRDDVAVSSLNVSPLIDGQQQNIAHSWSGGTQSASLNGLLNTGSYNAIYPGISQLSIGFSEISAGSPQYLSGTIRRLTFWPARLPNETLQTITQ